MYVVVAAAVLWWRVVRPACGLGVPRHARGEGRARGRRRRVGVDPRAAPRTGSAARPGSSCCGGSSPPATSGPPTPTRCRRPPPTHRLRLTVKDAGDHSSALARLRPGVPVLAEGPFGHFTAAAASPATGAADRRRLGHRADPGARRGAQRSPAPGPRHARDVLVRVPGQPRGGPRARRRARRPGRRRPDPGQLPGRPPRGSRLRPAGGRSPWTSWSPTCGTATSSSAVPAAMNAAVRDTLLELRRAAPARPRRGVQPGMSVASSQRGRRVAGLAGLLGTAVAARRRQGRHGSADAPSIALASPSTPRTDAGPRPRGPRARKSARRPPAPPRSTGAASAPDRGPSSAQPRGHPYGTVQVSVTLAGGRITDVQAVQLPSGGRSGEIAAYAAPRLRREVLAAQSAQHRHRVRRVLRQRGLRPVGAVRPRRRAPVTAVRLVHTIGDGHLARRARRWAPSQLEWTSDARRSGHGRGRAAPGRRDVQHLSARLVDQPARPPRGPSRPTCLPRCSRSSRSAPRSRS